MLTLKRVHSIYLTKTGLLWVFPAIWKDGKIETPEAVFFTDNGRHFRRHACPDELVALQRANSLLEITAMRHEGVKVFYRADVPNIGALNNRFRGFEDTDTDYAVGQITVEPNYNTVNLEGEEGKIKYCLHHTPAGENEDESWLAENEWAVWDYWTTEEKESILALLK